MYGIHLSVHGFLYVKTMKVVTLIIFFLVASSLGAFAQFSPPKLSLGIQYSDILSVKESYTDGNTWKRGVWGTLGTDYKILKWLAIEGNITYQERKPLEVFTFPWGDSTSMGKEGNFTLTFSEYPTSPQSKKFREPGGLRFTQFPNFKYLNIEIIPLFRFGRRIEWSVGVGLFGGILLNRNLLIFGKEHFVHQQFFFGPPFYASGTVSYHRYDYGWIPKISCAYPLNAKTKIGVSVKSYQSRVRLNDNFAHGRTSLGFDMRWTAFLAGIDVQYKF